MIIKPLTQRLFGKENIRQIVREWLEENKITDLGCRERLTTEIIEHNIEWFELYYMQSLERFVTDIHSFYITTVCYENILEGRENRLTEEYITLLQKTVKSMFYGKVMTREYDKEFKLNYKFESYLCLETVDDLFYAGEIYKHFPYWGIEGIHGNRVDLSGRIIEDRKAFGLVPQGGGRHLVVPEAYIESFVKIENYARPEFKVA